VVGVGAMAFKAFVGEDGADVEVVADLIAFAVGVVVEAGGKDEYACCYQCRYGSNATDGSRFNLKINYFLAGRASGS
jgi:hypothetical protein